jgi:hypothetical protein
MQNGVVKNIFIIFIELPSSRLAAYFTFPTIPTAYMPLTSCINIIYKNAYKSALFSNEPRTYADW